MSMKKKKLSGTLIILISVIFLLALWKIVSLAVNAEIILPGPEIVALKTVVLFMKRGFWASVGATLLRGIIGFIISAVSGLIFGVLLGLSKRAALLFKPLLSVIKTTPVMSIVIIALIWFKAGSVPVFSAFLIAFPIVTGNVMEGIANVEKNLVQMAEVYRVPRRMVITGLYIPSTLPYFMAGASTALGLTWKVIIAGEVLAQPFKGIGTGMFLAKVYLETAEVFAWTLCALILSAGTEWLFALLSRNLPGRRN